MAQAGARSQAFSARGMPQADDMGSGEESDEEEDDESSMDDIGTPQAVVAIAPGGDQFPMVEYNQLVEGLQRLSWMVYPSSLAKCLEAATLLASDNSDLYRRAQNLWPRRAPRRSAALSRVSACREERSQLVRQWAPLAFEKCLESTAVYNWAENIIDMARAFPCLAPPLPRPVCTPQIWPPNKISLRRDRSGALVIS